MKSELDENYCLDCYYGNVPFANVEMEVNKMYGHNIYINTAKFVTRLSKQNLQVCILSAKIVTIRIQQIRV